MIEAREILASWTRRCRGTLAALDLAVERSRRSHAGVNEG